MTANLNDKPLLSARNLGKHYGQRLGCRDVSFDLYEGEVLAVVGLFNQMNKLADAYQVEPDVLPRGAVQP